MALVYIPDEMIHEIYGTGIDKGTFVKEAIRTKLDTKHNVTK